MSRYRIMGKSGHNKQGECLINRSPNPVRVYIGNPHTIFIFQRSNLDQSPVLSRLVSFDSASGYYVMSPLLSLIDPADFEEVAQYLEYQEYFPEIYDADTDFVSLDGLDSQEDKIETTDRCMIVTLVAQKLEMPELQALAVSKFKALQPFRGDQFLVLTQLLLGSSLEWEGPMYDFVVEYFSVSIHVPIPNVASVRKKIADDDLRATFGSYNEHTETLSMSC